MPEVVSSLCDIYGEKTIQQDLVDWLTLTMKNAIVDPSSSHSTSLHGNIGKVSGSLTWKNT